MEQLSTSPLEPAWWVRTTESLIYATEEADALYKKVGSINLGQRWRQRGMSVISIFDCGRRRKGWHFIWQRTGVQRKCKTRHHSTEVGITLKWCTKIPFNRTVVIKWCACCRQATQFKEECDRKYDWDVSKKEAFTTTTSTEFYQPTSDLDFSAKKHGWIIQMNETRRKACECMNAQIYMSQVAQTDASEASSESSKA